MGIFDAFKGSRDKAGKAAEAVKEQVQEQTSAGASAPASPARSSADATSRFTEEAASATQAAADRLRAEAAAPDLAREDAQREERPAASKDTEPKSRTYTVKPGDSLAAIARHELGDELRWHEIYALNKETIGGNPDLILPGTVLRLP
ncbi:LysM peptidoglycan-binding domain-containing protein [Streptomyces sp. NPDC050418]|uniref:LysM peptidoglycan-binding domain-containing protein n=1 Tax=Streptomyces sp. NPDC050418 TaxID=3365612 RepID=UPI0037AE9F26